MQFDGCAISGPVLAAATTLAAIAIDRHLIGVPDPAPLLVLIVALAGSCSGFRSGLISAAVGIVGSALFLLDQRATPGYQTPDLIRLAMLAVTAGATAAITGLMRQQLMDSLAHERAEHHIAQRLAAALDEVDIGIVLLESDTRAEFINRAFRSYFGLPDAKADSRPAFVALMYHGRDTGAFELPADELKAFIARRMEMMRSGDSTPINIRLKDGTVLRFSCTALPDGGRMLSYTPVTDLVRYADEPTEADYFRALRGSSDRALARQLRAAE